MSLEHIEGLNVGGWFDAGDFDIQTPSSAISCSQDFCRSLVRCRTGWNKVVGDLASLNQHIAQQHGHHEGRRGINKILIASFLGKTDGCS